MVGGISAMIWIHVCVAPRVLAALCNQRGTVAQKVTCNATPQRRRTLPHELAPGLAAQAGQQGLRWR